MFTGEAALTGPAPPLEGGVPSLDPPESELAMAPYYEIPIAQDDVDVAVAAGVRREDVESDIARVLQLAPALRDVALRSVGHSAARDSGPARERLMSDDGLPLIWTYLATESGLIVSYPGTPEAGYPEDYDPRVMGWYEVGLPEPGPAWNLLDADESGMGLLLTCSQAMHDREGRILGVAAVDIGFGHLVDELLEAPVLRDHSEAFLVDEQRRVVARSSQKELARTVTEFEPPPFPWPEALPDESLDRALGWAELEGENWPLLLHWRRLQAVDWTYVIVGPRDPLLTLGRAGAPEA